MELLTQIRYLVWGPFTILFMLLTGVYMTLRTGCIQLRCIPWLWKQLHTHKTTAYQGISPLQALSTSLGGTLGVGNLAGVAAAITLGGAGAVFYMLLAAFFGMATKFAEIALAVRFRTRQNGQNLGGPMVFLTRGTYHPYLAQLFCICCIFASLSTGAMTQAGAITQAVAAIRPLSPCLIVCCIGFCAYPVLRGGNQMIAKTSQVIVPIMTIFYILGAILVLFQFRQQIIPSFVQIITDAFTPQAAQGGVFGVITSHAVANGFAKGVFSNEAGMGSAPIAHGCADSQSPCEEGMLGAIEVFIDTCVVCLLTALVILSTGVNQAGTTGLALTTAAFSTVLGRFAPAFICVTVCFLAFSTIIGWSFYGTACLRYLFGSIKFDKPYHFLICISILCSAFLPLDTLLLAADIAAAFMAFPNLIGLWTLAPIVSYEVKRWKS